MWDYIQPKYQTKNNYFTGLVYGGLTLCGKTHLSNDFGTSEVQTRQV